MSEGTKVFDSAREVAVQREVLRELKSAVLDMAYVVKCVRMASLAIEPGTQLADRLVGLQSSIDKLSKLDV